MSNGKEIRAVIDSIENALKKSITQKNELSGCVDKIRSAKPLAETNFGYDGRPALLLKEAEMCFRRAHSEAELATRKMASAIAYVADGDDYVRQTQTDAFAQSGQAEEEDVHGEPLLQIGDGNHPTIDEERTRPGGDAHDSYSLDLIHRDGVPQLRGTFTYAGRATSRWP